MTVYYATKAYVLSFSEALASELEPRGIRVCALCPGPVPTEFAERAGIKKDIAPNAITHSADFVAQQGYAGLMAGKRVVVPGLVNKLVILLLRFIPRGFVSSVVDKRQAKRRSARKV